MKRNILPLLIFFVSNSLSAQVNKDEKEIRDLLKK